jgi:hypothetical protein
MATIIRTLEEKGHWEGGTPGHWNEAVGPKGKRTWVPGEDPVWVSDGYEVVKEQQVTRGNTSVRRGALTQRTVEAWQSGQGRRNRSVYAAKALGSGQGVLAPADAVFTRDPIHTVEQVHPAGLPQCAKPRIRETSYRTGFPTAGRRAHGTD